MVCSCFAAQIGQLSIVKSTINTINNLRCSRSGPQNLKLTQIFLIYLSGMKTNWEFWSNGSSSWDDVKTHRRVTIKTKNHFSLKPKWTFPVFDHLGFPKLYPFVEWWKKEKTILVTSFSHKFTYILCIWRPFL